MDNYDWYVDYVCGPAPFWEHLRTAHPVVWSSAHGGYHLLAKYEDVRRAARDTRTFSSASGVSTSAEVPTEAPLIPIEIDPPEQTEYRQVINPLLSRPETERREPWIRAIARDLIDRFKGDETVEFCRAFALPFPQTVTMRVIGLPETDLDSLRPCLNHLTVLPCEDPRVAVAAAATFEQLHAVVRRRRSDDADGADSDLIGALLRGRVQGRPLTDDEAVRSLTILLLGALGTTTRTIAESIRFLGNAPEHRKHLGSPEADWEVAVEEFLRFVSPVHGIGRVATAGTVVGGCPIRRGEKVRLLYASANRDEEVFDHPDEVDLDRWPNLHLAFGTGAHRCVGRHLAKLMVTVALQELLTCFPDINLRDVDPPTFVGMETGSAIATLPVRLGRQLSKNTGGTWRSATS